MPRKRNLASSFGGQIFPLANCSVNLGIIFRENLGEKTTLALGLQPYEQVFGISTWARLHFGTPYFNTLCSIHGAIYAYKSGLSRAI